MPKSGPTKKRSHQPPNITYHKAPQEHKQTNDHRHVHYSATASTSGAARISTSSSTVRTRPTNTGSATSGSIAEGPDANRDAEDASLFEALDAAYLELLALDGTPEKAKRISAKGVSTIHLIPTS